MNEHEKIVYLTAFAATYATVTLDPMGREMSDEHRAHWASFQASKALNAAQREAIAATDYSEDMRDALGETR
jgi:hypothetical protein